MWDTEWHFYQSGSVDDAANSESASLLLFAPCLTIDIVFAFSCSGLDHSGTDGISDKTCYIVNPKTLHYVCAV
jgi:hypothetical protein